jgi:hydrogenase nickel incorporation protein HypA/HybF
VHELSICSSIARIVLEHAGGRRVTFVSLDVGHLRQVVPQTLVHSWEVTVAGTALEGSQVVVNHIPAVIACRQCGTSTTLEAPVFRCSCGSVDVEVVSGRELTIHSIEVAVSDPVQ